MPRAWCLLILLLVGCTQPTPEAEPDPRGGVAGVVVTPAIEPLPGASILLEATGLAATSDVFGRFHFDDLEPGTYQMVASAEKRMPEKLSVTVHPGETARPRIVLAPESVLVVGHETHEFQGFVPSWLGAAQDAGPDLGSCTCVFEVSAPAPLAGITLEAVWHDSIQRHDAPTEYQWNVTVDESVQGAGPSPLHVHVLASHMDLNGTTVTVSLVPDETWPAYDQSYQIFLTLWQGTEPPQEWSRVRGDS